jgi:hypothetical protein
MEVETIKKDDGKSWKFESFKVEERRGYQSESESESGVFYPHLLDTIFAALHFAKTTRSDRAHNLRSARVARHELYRERPEDVKQL